MARRCFLSVLVLLLGLGLGGCGSKSGRDAATEGRIDGAVASDDARTDNSVAADVPGADLALDHTPEDVPTPLPDAAPDAIPDAGDSSADSFGSDAGCGSPNDPKNCGSCGHDCTQLPHVRPDKVECRDGACVIAPDGCFPGFAHCSNNADAGCEVNITRTRSCGDCSTLCTGAARLCATPASGPAMCVDSCATAGLTECTAQGSFERHCVDLQSHRDHCGACDAPCRIPGAEANCVAGQCVVEKCMANRADCDPARPGCETTLRTFDDCRACGDSCEAAHAIGTCEPAGCMHTCHPGYGNCATANPDCETALDTAANCGACGNACPADRPLCGGGPGERACVAACAAPTGDRCGSSCTNLMTERLHCGACETVCADYQVCAQGRCSPRYIRTDVIADPGVDRAQLGAVAAAMGPDGSYVVGGFFQGSVDFDPGPGQDLRQTDDTSDLFITKFDAQDGHAWTQTLPANPGRLAIAADGSVIAVGYSQGSVDFDPGPGTDVRQGFDLFVLKLAPTGSLVWVSTFAVGTEGSIGAARDVAVGPDGTILITGTFNGRVDLDPGAGTDVREAVTNPMLGSVNNMYVVKLSAAGNLVWARTFVGQIEPSTIAVHPNGAVWIGGSFVSSADFDPGPAVDLQSPSNAFGFGAFATRLDAAGNHLGALTIPAMPNLYASTIAFDSDGSAYIGGLASAGGGDQFFLEKLSATASQLWIKTSSTLNLKATAPGGGFFARGADVGGGAGSAGLLVRKHNGSGDPVWTIPSLLPASAVSQVNLVAADAIKLVIVGYAETGGDFDPGSGSDIIKARGLFITRYAF